MFVLLIVNYNYIFDLKKLGIFNEANKKLTELRQTVVTKDLEIEELKKSKSSVDESQSSFVRSFVC